MPLKPTSVFPVLIYFSWCRTSFLFFHLCTFVLDSVQRAGDHNTITNYMLEETRAVFFLPLLQLSDAAVSRGKGSGCCDIHSALYLLSSLFTAVR